MIPHQQKMVARLADEPFTLLGINSDGESRSALKEKFENEKVTWPQIVEGKEYPLSGAWNVHGFPTIYVLDHEGIIRARGFLQMEEIEKTVDEQLEKVPDVG